MFFHEKLDKSLKFKILSSIKSLGGISLLISVTKFSLPDFNKRS